MGQKEQSLPERMRAGRMRIRRTVTGRTRRFIFIPTPGQGILPVMKRSRGSIIQDQSFDVELDSIKAAEPPAKESISETRVVSEEIIRQAAGSWTLNGPKTDAGLRQHGSLLEMFGTSLHMGNGLEISDNGEIEYYIGIGTGGEGQCTETGGSAETGSSITASITPYEDHGNSQNSLTLHLITEDDTEYLTMEYDGEILYWNR